MRLRSVVLIAMVVLIGLRAAAAEDLRCRQTGKGEDYVEWFDGKSRVGVKFVDADPGWARQLTIEDVYVAGCRICRNGQGLNALFFTLINDQKVQNLSSLLDPDQLVASFSRLPGLGTIDLLPKGVTAPLPLFGLPGIAARMTAKFGSNTVQALATAAGRDCLGFVGLVILPDAREITFDDFKPFATSMTLQWYEPKFVPLPHLGRDCRLALGAARSKCEQEPPVFPPAPPPAPQ